MTTYDLDILNCQDCPDGLVTSSNSSSYPVSSSYFVDNGDGTGGFISPMACVTQPGFGVYGSRGLPCPKGTYNTQDNYNECMACAAPLTTAGVGAGVTAADCGAPAGYGYHSGAVGLCPVGELSYQRGFNVGVQHIAVTVTVTWPGLHTWTPLKGANKAHGVLAQRFLKLIPL
jgi:hypothetical protein